MQARCQSLAKTQASSRGGSAGASDLLDLDRLSDWKSVAFGIPSNTNLQIFEDLAASAPAGKGGGTGGY